jgi:uncharacterized membrane protein YeaQ/YmgE (transglycosylase-associated protein family)
MTALEFVILLVMAAVLGILSQRLLGYKLGGLFVSIILGFLGGLVGKLMYGWFSLPIIFSVQIGSESFPVLWSLVGALLVTFLFGLVARSASKEQKKKK